MATREGEVPAAAEGNINNSDVVTKDSKDNNHSGTPVSKTTSVVASSSSMYSTSASTSWTKRFSRWLWRIWRKTSMIPTYEVSPNFYYCPEDEVIVDESKLKMAPEEFEEHMKDLELANGDGSQIRKAFPIFSKLLKASGIYAPMGCSKKRMLIHPLLHTAICALLLVYEIVFFISTNLLTTFLLGILCIMSAISVWLGMVTIHSGHLQKSVNRVMRLPETKHKYLRRIDKKQAVIIGIVLVVSIILSILFFLAKYKESPLGPAYFAVYILYFPLIVTIIIAIASFVVQTDVDQIIINHFLQIVQTEEVRRWTIYQLTQYHLKYVRNQVEQSSYKHRLYLLFMLFCATSFVICVGYLLLFQDSRSSVVLISRVGILLVGMVLLTFILYPGSSVSDRARKCMKYVNIGIASNHIICNADEKLSILMYLQLANVMFKIYGIGLTRGFVLNVIYVTITFLLVTLQRLAVFLN